MAGTKPGQDETTSGGRRAKVTVLLHCICWDKWLDPDKDADYDIEMTRNLLLEFVGGEAAQQARDQFRVEMA
jgi:hypothetical protein